MFLRISPFTCFFFQIVGLIFHTILDHGENNSPEKRKSLTPPPNSNTLCDFRQIYLVPFSTFSEGEVFTLILAIEDL